MGSSVSSAVVLVLMVVSPLGLARPLPLPPLPFGIPLVYSCWLVRSG